MSSSQKTVSVFLTLIGGLLLVILGLWLRWPDWMWLVAAGVLATSLAVAVTAATRARRREPFPSGTLPERPAPPVEKRELYVNGVRLPSDLPDYDFRFSATVRWCPLDGRCDSPVINPGALAVEGILARARTVTTTRHPHRSSLVQHELNGVLGVMQPTPGKHVQALALDISLTLDDADQVRLDRLSAIRKDEAVWEHERRHEQDRRHYLESDVLQSTGSAVVWWLAKHDDQVEKTVKDIGLLARLTSAANNTEVARPFRHLVPEAFPAPEAAEDDLEPPDYGPDEEPGEKASAKLFADFARSVGLEPGAEESLLMAEQVAMAVAPHDPDTAEAIQRDFDRPAGDEGATDGTSPEDSATPGSPRAYPSTDPDAAPETPHSSEIP